MGVVGGGVDGRVVGGVVSGGIDGRVVAVLTLLVCSQTAEGEAHPRPDHGQGWCACGRRN